MRLALIARPLSALPITQADTAQIAKTQIMAKILFRKIPLLVGAEPAWFRVHVIEFDESAVAISLLNVQFVEEPATGGADLSNYAT